MKQIKLKKILNRSPTATTGDTPSMVSREEEQQEQEQEREQEQEEENEKITAPLLCMG